MVFSSTLTLPTLLFFVYFFQVYMYTLSVCSYSYYSENQNWATKLSTGSHAARGLDIAGLELG